MKKCIKALAATVLAAAVVAVSFVGYTPRDVYTAAVDAMKQGDYEMARSHLERLDTRDAKELMSELYFVPNRVATTYEDGATQLQSYAYNRKGNIVKAELTDNEQVVATTSYDYTSDGQLLAMEVLVPEQEKPTTTQECFYDETGRLTCSRTLGEQGLFYQTQYTYDLFGRCSSTFYVNGNGEWERTELAYNQAGQTIAQKVTAADPTDNTLTRYEYHANGQLKGQKQTTAAGITAHTYSEAGLLLKTETTTAQGEIQTATYTYDAQNRLTEMVNSNGEKQVCRYNKAGQLTYKLEQKSDTQWTEILLEYKDGNLVKRQVNDSDRDLYTEVYKYNKKDWCTSYQYKNEVTGQWYKYTYAYDRHGNLEKETYKAETGSYERTYKWKVRHYPEGMPQMVEDVREECQTTPRQE